jgi:hypothetical protein
MESGKRNKPGWLLTVTGFGRSAVPYAFAVTGLALGVDGVVQSRPAVAAAGAVAGAGAAFIQHWRIRRHRDHVAALRERLRTQRLESEQVTAELRQTVSGLQTDLWQHRLVAMATPAFGLQLSALNAPEKTSAPEKAAVAEKAAAEAGTPGSTGTPTPPRRPKPFAQAS